MNKQRFKLMELIQFYIHLVSLIIGGILIVYMSNSIDNFKGINTFFIVIMIILIVIVIFLSIYQIRRVQLYNKHYKDDPDVSIWKTVATLICYPLDLIMYGIVLFVLLMN